MDNLQLMCLYFCFMYRMVPGHWLVLQGNSKWKGERMKILSEGDLYLCILAKKALAVWR